MSLENFWELFAETGDIRYYLLYAESVYRHGMHEKGRRHKSCGDEK